MQNAPNASKHSFLPSLFSCERKNWAAGGASETTATERAAARDVSYPLCSFFPFQTASETCGLGFSMQTSRQPLGQPSADSSPERGARGVCAFPMPSSMRGAFVRCGGVQSLSRLRRQLPLHKGALGCARKKPSLRGRAQKRPRRNALLSGPVTENSEHHTPRAAARRTARPAPGRSRRCGRP